MARGGKRKGAGRPPLPKKRRRDVSVMVQLNEGELALLETLGQEIAAEAGAGAPLSRAATLRHALQALALRIMAGEE